MPSAGWLRKEDLPVDGANRRYIDVANLDQLLDQHINWRGDVNAGSHRLLNAYMDNAHIGAGQTGNRVAYIDLVGDDFYADYGLRIIRHATGQNADSGIYHRGTGLMTLQTQEAGAINFLTNSVERMRIAADGKVIVQSADGTNNSDQFQVGITMFKYHMGRAEADGKLDFFSDQGAPYNGYRFYVRDASSAMKTAIAIGSDDRAWIESDTAVNRSLLVLHRGVGNAAEIHTNNNGALGETFRLAFFVTRDGWVHAGTGGWNTGGLRMGGHYLWIDAIGRLRIKGGAPPASDTDGTVVGTQT